MPRLRDVADHDPSIDDERLALTAMRARIQGFGRPAGRLARVAPAPSRTARPGAAALSIVLALVLGAAGPGGALAADPTPDPAVATARPPTCAERFPEEGPAGVDLRLGCIVSEVVGWYTAGQSAPPPPLSTYAILVGFAVAAGVLLVVVAGRLVARRAGERLAPVLAAEWWICATCRSVNAAGVERCYSCGGGRPDGPTLTTDDRPEIPQSFGSTRKRG